MLRKITFIAFLYFSFVTPEEIIVETTNGFVKGNQKQTISEQTNYYRFLGIPYAEPPIGDLRLENPIAKRNWTGTLDCTNYPSMCVQLFTTPIQGSENCLYINIYSPQLNNNLPVIIWIHGGGFITGSSQINPDNFLDQGIVFVAIQYRLGCFGFLSTGDSEIPGNIGLKDQILAIEWIHRNVGFFGGDSNNVTLFGQSAGAASISYLIQSKKITGLYQRAIIDSGVSLCMWSLARNTPEFTASLATNLNSSDLKKQLKSLDYATFQDQCNSIYLDNLAVGNPVNSLPLSPVIEPEAVDGVVMHNSHELLTTGDFDQIPILLGHNSMELPIQFSVFEAAYASRLDVPNNLVPIDMNVTNKANRDEIQSQIKEEYFKNSLVSLSNKELSEFVSDSEFVRPVQEYAKSFARYASTYYYEFTYEGALGGKENRTQSGTSHTEELGYLFPMGYTGTAQDYCVSKLMVYLWSNFAKYGNPTPSFLQPNEITNITWPKANSDPSGILNINIGANLTIVKNLRGDRINFWTNLYQRYGINPFDTY